ncbi:MAG: DUF4149 domain-containing protein [Pseudomonadota bacterium]
MATLALVIAAGTLGAMLFFSFATAPLVFRMVADEDAARFIRALFPIYYAVAAVGTAAAGILVLPDWTGWLLVLVALVSLGLRQGLTPLIGDSLDARRAGDAAAAERFDRLHRLSVLANVGQFAALAVAIVGIAV